MTLHDLATKHAPERSPAHNLFGTTLPANRVDSVFALAQKTREEK